MSSIIEFLERVGQDADLRGNVARSIADAPLDFEVKTALLSRDQKRLDAVLAVESNVCCIVAVPYEDEGSDDRSANEITSGSH